jgi:hypothetical protein
MERMAVERTRAQEWALMASRRINIILEKYSRISDGCPNSFYQITKSDPLALPGDTH